MAAFGQRGVSLLKEIVNHEPDTLSAYNEEVVRLVLSEVHEHEAQVRHIVSLSAQQQADTNEEEAGASAHFDNPADSVALVIHHESMIRNKRLLLSYMLQRMDRLKTVRWKHRQLPGSVSEACSPQEREFYRAYDKLLTKYMSHHEGVGHDLTLECQPPRDNAVHVRVLKDAGVRLFSFGRLALHEGALIKLPVDEAEPLIAAGLVHLHDRSEFA
ncbi:hypothetical protein QJQ45_025502 [Haematococcus lacustris]|nr:hypothetical protein QJQ45_025502 [Haematococcus lacustris]